MEILKVMVQVIMMEKQSSFSETEQDYAYGANNVVVADLMEMENDIVSTWHVRIFDNTGQGNLKGCL